jgi:hypothetical protein
MRNDFGVKFHLDERKTTTRRVANLVLEFYVPAFYRRIAHRDCDTEYHRKLAK